MGSAGDEGNGYDIWGVVDEDGLARLVEQVMECVTRVATNSQRVVREGRHQKSP